MVRQNKLTGANLDFYVGTDTNGNKIPIPFENILITGYSGTGKSMFIHNLIMDTLLRCTRDKISFKIWSRNGEYDLWDNIYNKNERTRKIPNLKVFRDCNQSESGLSITEFLRDAMNVSKIRYDLLNEHNAKNIWRYNLIMRDNGDDEMVPLVYIVDSWDTELPEEAVEYFLELMKYNFVTGISLIWVGQSEKEILNKCSHDYDFYKFFQSKITFHSSVENSERVLGSSIAANEDNHGVFLGECIYQRYYLPYVPLDVPKFSYSLGKKIARALSQEISNL